MLKRSEIRTALRKNLRWFECSGLMRPSDGSWGVAERVLLTGNNESTELTFKSFPAWTHYESHSIMEHRRPDCNFETALLFELAAQEFNSPKYHRSAENILNYLYNLSGMLNRNKQYPDFAADVWKWCNIQWRPAVYFDDNAWCITIPLLLARLCPDFEKKFQMRRIALNGADALAEAFASALQSPDWDQQLGWSGKLKLPHWGSLAVMALASAARENPAKSDSYRALAEQYQAYVAKDLRAWNTSEQSYALLGSLFAANSWPQSKDFSRQAEELAALICSLLEQNNGCLPSNHYEAPAGTHLIDLIYTMNWAFLALHSSQALHQKPDVSCAFHKMMELLLQIQDRSPRPELSGCWRGMYDLEQKCWGGGNRFEGGAGSIYSGWTNTSIALALCYFLNQRSIITD